MKEFLNDFDDSFFYALFVLVLLLSLIDWLLGEVRRKAMRESVGVFWLHLDELTKREVVFSSSEKFLRALQTIFGKRAISARRIVATAAVSSLALPTALMSHLLDKQNYKESSFYIPLKLYSYANPVLTFVLVYICAELTLRLISRANTSQSTIFFMLFSLLDLLVSIFFFSIIFGMAYFVYWGVELYVSMVVLGGRELEEVYREVSTGDVWTRSYLVEWIDGFASAQRAEVLELTRFSYLSLVGNFLASALLTVSHLLFVFMVLSMKVFQRFLAPPVMLILIRLHESKKGVLTNLAIVVSSIVKIVQQAIKLYA